MKKFIFARSFLSRIVLSAIFAICSSNAYSQNGLLLSCELKGGYPDTQIYINEVEKYVIYNAQYGDNYERKRVYKSDSGETQEIDAGMDITFNNDIFIQASDNSASFVFMKETLTFAYAWTTPVPGKDGKFFLAFGNHTEGKCSVNPFSRPDK